MVNVLHGFLRPWGALGVRPVLRQFRQTSWRSPTQPRSTSKKEARLRVNLQPWHCALVGPRSRRSPSRTISSRKDFTPQESKMLTGSSLYGIVVQRRQKADRTPPRVSIK